MQSTIPSLDEFLAAPSEQVAAVAPTTVMLGAGSAPLAAAYAGVDPMSQDYARLAQERLMACIGLLFGAGVRHVAPFVMNAGAKPGQPPHERFVQWVAYGTAGSDLLAFYQQQGWTARLAGGEGVPALEQAALQLREATPADGARRVWWTFATSTDGLWASLADAATRAEGRTQADLIRAFYGEDIPPATLFLGFGKPYVAPGFLPMLLSGDMQCFWSQRPLLGLDEAMLRRIIYDYAFVRPTRGSGDRSARYNQLQNQREAWETDAVLGVGQHLDGFWYPSPFPGVAERGE